LSSTKERYSQLPKYFCRSALIQQGLQKNSRQIARR